jgi:hypothetical protein
MFIRFADGEWRVAIMKAGWRCRSRVVKKSGLAVDFAEVRRRRTT